MAVRSRRPWMSVVVGLILGFTAASWLIAPKVAEMSEKKRSNVCSYYNRVGDRAHGQPGGMRTAEREDPWQGRGMVPNSSPATGLEDEEIKKKKETMDSKSNNTSRHKGNHSGSGDWGPPEESPRNFLYVGVMTAKKYLDTRAVAAFKTWARYIPGKVEFFSSEGSEEVPLPEPMPVISLPGVDDSYPPQKKSFMMIKHMHDNYLDKYEWFMRADDDVYIKGKYNVYSVSQSNAVIHSLNNCVYCQILQKYFL
uniref:Fringe-like glycosyltransferase domain-containing protein n=1 Tax=Leptobrachium leishanense TaxID=445787 RepID=A0A8C5QA73_9ANUR